MMMLGTRRTPGFGHVGAAVGALFLVVLVGCSTKNGMSTTDGMDGDRPLTGFSKNPGDEKVAGGLPFGGSGGAGGSGGSGGFANGHDRKNGVAVVDVYFPFDRWALLDEERKSLVASADFLKKHPKARLLIEGYCDERGSGEYNLVLGEKRARETRQFLMDLGIKNAVAVKSYGKERSVCTEQSESCYWRNRRAHLMIDAE
jgi:peptidoglycan-associated lipoprotein